MYSQPQGCTIRPDLRIFWGQRSPLTPLGKALESEVTEGQTATRLGTCTFLQFNSAGNNFDVMIQASTSTASSPLQAEAQGLVLAVKLVELLEINNPTFLTDNLTLA